MLQYICQTHLTMPECAENFENPTKVAEVWGGQKMKPMTDRRQLSQALCESHGKI